MTDPPATDAAAIAALQARGRFGIRLGLGPHAGPAAGARVARGGPARGAHRRHQRQGAARRRWSPPCCAPAGLRVGQTPKPHLVHYRERIVVDGRPIAAAPFAALLDEVLAAADGGRAAPRAPDRVRGAHGGRLPLVRAVGRGRRDRGGGPGWPAGRHERVGRLVWPPIVNVQRDHMEYLGDTPDRDRPREGRHHQARRSRGDGRGGRRAGGHPAARGAPGRVAGRHRRRSPWSVSTGWARCSATRSWATLRLGLIGRHQGANVAVALGVLDALGDGGHRRASAPTRSGAAWRRSRWPGRMELLALGRDGRPRRPPDRSAIPGQPDVVLDGAHNAAGARRARGHPRRARPLPLGRSSDAGAGHHARQGGGRDARRAADLVGPGTRAGAGGDRAGRAAGPARRRARLPPGAATGWRLADGSPERLQRAIELARVADGPLVVAGSLYLVGAVRGALLPDGPWRATHDRTAGRRRSSCGADASPGASGPSSWASST